MIYVRRSVRLLTVAIILMLTAVFSIQQVRADDALAWAVGTPNLRTGPGLNFPVVASLKYQIPVIIEGRNADSSWLLVHEKDGPGRGWGKTTLFKIAPGVKVAGLPIKDDQLGDTQSGVKAPPLPANVPTVDLSAPPVPEINSKIRITMRSIYQRGQQMGNNPRVFSKVGDCHTDHPAFLDQFGTDKYSVGSYGNLQEIITYFSVAPRPGQANSFIMASQAAHSAFTSADVLAKEAILDPAVCNKNESPLDCEYRINKPSYAIIDFGVVDVLVMTPQQFNLYMRYIIQETERAGVIPILSTAGENTSQPAKAHLFNQVVVNLANQKNLPLINLEGALASLPNKGMDADGIHLTRPDDISQTGFLTPQNLQFGYTMRNLLTLQTLDEVMHTVVTQ